MADGGMIADTITIRGKGGDAIGAYFAQPVGDGPFPGVVVIQHVFGVDEWISEVCRKLAHRGYAAVAPNLYHRMGDIVQGASSPQDIIPRLREKGGLNDDVVMGDVAGAADFLRSREESSGRVGTIGFCMGGRFAYLAACRVDALNAAVDCWGGGVGPDTPPPGGGTLPIDLTADMKMPLLGIFGNDDAAPSPAEVDRTEARLKMHNKTYEFYRYDGAGHGFFATDRTNYRQEQAVDGWKKVFAFYEKHLGPPVGSK